MVLFYTLYPPVILGIDDVVQAGLMTFDYGVPLQHRLHGFLLVLPFLEDFVVDVFLCSIWFY